MADATGELVQWLGKQLDEDERIRDDWHHRDCESIPVEGHNGPFPCDCGVPERVLREIDAKRRILDLHPYSVLRQHVGDRWKDDPDPKYDRTFCDTCHVEDGSIQDNGGRPCETLRLLALPYADRPGYCEGWRP